MSRITINEILKKKGKKNIVCLTAYSKPIAEILDKYCDIILVGDSVGNVVYGTKSTREVKLETMMLHAKAVRNSTKKSLVVFDMPYRTYSNKLLAYKNAKKVIKFTKCDAIKLEGGKKISKIVSYLVKRKIPVMGHIGLLPQYSYNFNVRGKNSKQRQKILDDACVLSNSGVFAVVLECVVENLAKRITKILSIPTIGIGASKHCDGQILVTDDMIGLSDFYPKFVRKYSNVRKIIEQSVKKYRNDILKNKFPSFRNVYKF